ncbi:ABC transporter ATP-binding protein [Gordonia sp. (in: high G+C Gram-positive bacteria)]|uniref:ABC transporter ATP-binding protein n=1 Tax=Gordonia sp. (in: high G+C Gram-positive bacteria) TaxID=84139 RepID=UPI001D8FE1A3|nr:ABC transporter ATP-binding protein [Gordonia sp. (in: high G+C Gram-positive bacteria)]MCB1296691.1 ABC transporter ATP-binding protein [Gordonia sp. (in: high G+C Gram-positive bacteria)]HMS75215.1 ABC transporter ATP-binding protein [Gordonia sp. (in: high G+C Gram-positive bacteria)]HQV18016.1 ABC transporter ATP-binding protein [Gordonia sp. (in: high G+C Gram-positive bacteria)]
MTRPGMQMGNVPGDKARSFGPSIKRIVRLLSEYRVLMPTILLALTASVILQSIAPRVLGHATDLVFNGVIGKVLPAGQTKAEAVAGLREKGQDTFADMVSSMDVIPGTGIDFGDVGRVLLIVLALYVVSMTLAWLASYLLNIVVVATIRRLRADVEAKIHRLPLRYYDSQPRGDLLSRVTNDLDNLSQSMQQTISQLLNSVLMVIALLVMMVVISPLLALIAIVTVPLAIGATAIIAKRSKPHFISQWSSTGKLNAQVEEAFTGHELVKAFGRQREVEQVFDERNQKLYESSWRAQFISGVTMPVIMFLGNLNYVAVAVVGGLRVASGSLSLGEVQAFIQYSRQFSQPLTQIGSMVNLLQSGVASAERIFDILDAAEESPDPVQPRSPLDDHGLIEFNDVSFRYAVEKPLIEDLSLVARPGQMVAIVGPTGAGKTTLVNLIMRFYDVDTGTISVDGLDSRLMTRADLRERTGMVLQDSWLFGGTIYDNIAYGDPTASREEVIAAATLSHVDAFVRHLPDGYDTVLDDEGGGVSAGERQLITIARAFLAKPTILILDEATSSVDTRTELLIQKAMARLRTDRTSFVIAHRLSTIRDADIIVVMEDGRIVEQGSHKQLLATRGAYYRLYNSQFAGAIESE